MSELASAADILGRSNRRFANVTVGDLTVRLRSITAGEYAELQRKLIDSASKGSTEAKRVAASLAAQATLIRLCCIDANGEPLFSDSQAKQLAEIDSAVARALDDACMKHCGLSDADPGELAKNSAETLPDSSPTA